MNFVKLRLWKASEAQCGMGSWPSLLSNDQIVRVTFAEGCAINRLADPLKHDH